MPGAGHDGRQGHHITDFYVLPCSHYSIQPPRLFQFLPTTPHHQHRLEAASFTKASILVGIFGPFVYIQDQSVMSQTQKAKLLPQN